MPQGFEAPVPRLQEKIALRDERDIQIYPHRPTDVTLMYTIGPVAQWIRHRPTEPGIAGSSPAGVTW